MSDIKITPKGTLEADIRDFIATPYNNRPYLTDAFLGKWADKAAADGLSKEQEDRAEQRIRVMREQSEAKIHELEELASQADQRANEQARERYRLEAEIKELRLELGRYMDAVDADGDGTAT